jgi:energy-coupling factor transporter ATP-binding protein EcfA2
MIDAPPETFEQFVCWDEQSVSKLMDTEADYVPEHVFAAIHHPMKMCRRELISASGSGQRKLTDQEEFLKSFMDDGEDFRFVPVLGKSGTGKSHLVRWMNTRIEENENRRVILIPKTGTNLRDVLRMILDGMEGETFEEYRQRLGETTTPVSDEEGQAQLLGNLARAVEFNSEDIVAQRTKGAGRQRQQLYEYTAKRLHHVLDDPYFRRHWLRDEGVIERIYDITLGASGERERLEEQRQFGREDLPLDVSAIGDASRAARDFYRQLNTQPRIQEAALDILNDGLDYAIPKVLNFSGEDLLQLMIDVRRSLAEREVELVLLIEDFAKLQGIHRQLLEALLERPERPEREPLCAMRTALACTDAYYATLEDTVQTRASFRVHLNLSSSEALG